MVWLNRNIILNYIIINLVVLYVDSNYVSTFSKSGILFNITKISQDGNYLVASKQKDSSDYQVTIYRRNGQNWNEQVTIDPPNSTEISGLVNCLYLSFDGSFFIFLDSKQNKIWYYKRDQTGLYSPDNPTSFIDLQTHSPLNSCYYNGYLCVVGSDFANIYQVTNANLNLYQSLTFNNTAINSRACAITPNTRTIVVSQSISSNSNQRILFFQFNSSNYVYNSTYETGHFQISAMSFSSDSKTLVISSTYGVTVYSRSCVSSSFTNQYELSCCVSRSNQIIMNGLYIVYSCLDDILIRIHQKIAATNYNLYQQISFDTFSGVTQLSLQLMSMSEDALYLTASNQNFFAVYKLSNNGDTSKITQNCIDTCSTCFNDKATCIIYNSQPSIETVACNGCASPCITCLQTQSFCQTCQSSFVPLATKFGACISCSTPCLTCSTNQNFCTSCKSDYKLVQNTCQFINTTNTTNTTIPTNGNVTQIGLIIGIAVGVSGFVLLLIVGVICYMRHKKIPKQQGQGLNITEKKLQFEQQINKVNQQQINNVNQENELKRIMNKLKQKKMRQKYQKKNQNGGSSKNLAKRRSKKNQEEI